MSKSGDLRVWSAEPLPGDVQRALGRLAGLHEVVTVAAMPDVHLAKDVCVGAVVATTSHLIPPAVGGDIGCGMAVLKLDATADVLDDRQKAARFLRFLGEHVPTATHRAKHASLPASLASLRLSGAALERKKNTIGRVQFGTLGRGNHFIELQRDTDGALWLMLHSGSRGIGQAIRDYHCRAADRGSQLVMVDADSSEGAAYLGDLEWALE